MQRSRILAAAVVAALSLSACGNGAGPDATQGGTLQDAPTDAAVAARNAAAAGEVANGGGAGAEAGHTALDRYPDAQRTCLEEVANLSGTPAAELVVTGTARTQTGVEVRVQRQELRSAWTCQTDAQGGTVLGVQDGRDT